MKKNNQFKQQLNNDGFSLIELVIVVAILAILTAIIVPSFIKYYERARKTRDLQGAEVIGTTFQRILALNPDAAAEWNGQLDANNFYGFAVEDYSKKKYYLANVFEYTMTQKGEIVSTISNPNNAQEGAIRDAYVNDKKIGFPICKQLLQEELTTNVKSMAYQQDNLRSFRLARNMNTGEPEVWICYVPKGSDGQGHTNGWVQYRAWPDPDPRYMQGVDAPIFQNTSGQNINKTITFKTYQYKP